jgi:hypothetical protein
MTDPRQSRLNGSRSKQRLERHRSYKLPRLTATMTCQDAFRAISRGCLDDLAVLSGSAAYALSEAMGWKWRLEKRPPLLAASTASQPSDVLADQRDSNAQRVDSVAKCCVTPPSTHSRNREWP